MQEVELCEGALLYPQHRHRLISVLVSRHKPGLHEVLFVGFWKDTGDFRKGHDMSLR